MQRPGLMWIRVADFAAVDVPRAIVAEYFQLHVCTGIAAACSAVQQIEPRVVCFDFEQPHPDQLRAMRDFKRLKLMLTAQHSEGLAIWAFRVRVWNFLVKPVRTNELRANFDVLSRLVSGNQGPSRAARCVGALLPEDVIEGSNPTATPPLEAAVKQVELHFARKLRQSAVAAVCGMSICAFSRAFKSQYGLTFREYLLRYRIGRACELLRRGTHNATDAGLAVDSRTPRIPHARFGASSVFAHQHFSAARRRSKALPLNGSRRASWLLKCKCLSV
jgi:AraC-like DNA-binding protein